jgi:hypothetical protein
VVTLENIARHEPTTPRYFQTIPLKKGLERCPMALDIKKTKKPWVFRSAHPRFLSSSLRLRPRKTHGQASKKEAKIPKQGLS